ncbi:unnamed protein product [Arabidopsis lyrata]|uniref:probable inactive cytidine deaminase 9 n=1 Tax=Arabidopsis lyrata subsp. lyrata TaxID=81972 RepID=UPI000A29A511|nr:probable inactive cytidine deaminase 9 [Arabidopsis lyrata subsp. lyrata]CAH8274921.1 unnamed protein product [Arabidopsis lyrata]|eukprot:XP_020875261.1 probable inactive cytidine deaminase 9 [Arabidopsis lyrata subsp. lyrata]
MALPLSSILAPNETEFSGDFTTETIMPLINRALPLARTLNPQLPRVVVGRGSSGRTFLGVNVDLRGLPLHYSIHAEQFLVVNLALHNERKLNCLAISAGGTFFYAPCGHCCHFLQEIRDASNTQILITDPLFRQNSMPLSTFLPQKFFSVYNEVPEYFARLLDHNRRNGLTLIDPNPIREICVNSDSCTHLKCRALNAANRSYAPYSNCSSGVALMDHQGKVYSGWYMESVAYNPSLGPVQNHMESAALYQFAQLGPVQAALVDFVTNGGGHEFDKIVQAVLVEKRVAKFSQVARARNIIKKIAHDSCVFKVLHFQEPVKSSE